MKTCQHRLPIGTLLLGLALAGVSPASANPFDDFKRTVDNTRRNVERQADNARRQAQRHADNARREAQRRADEARRDMQRRTRDASRNLQGQTNRLHRSANQAVQRTTRDLKHQTNSHLRRVERDYQQTRNKVERQIKSQINRAYAHCQRVGSEADRLARRYQGDIERFVTDPRNQERAVEAVIIAGTVMARLDEEPKKFVAEAVGSAGETLMIETPAGRVMSLNDYARQTIREQAPFLKGSSIEENPAEALTYIVAFQDTDYMVNELRIVPDERGRRVSVRDYAIAKAGLDAEGALHAMEMADAFATLADAEASPQDLVAAAQILEANKSLGSK